MSEKHQPVYFILNNETVEITVPAGTLALDYLRQRLQLTGTKEGCKEGDCGACTIILGELRDDGSVRYRPMTSCLLPVGELPGKHLVTVEGLSEGELSPVQAAMVDCGGTQCGYCTPGFVVAMTAGLMDSRLPLNRDGVLYAISGNLCRCTGYRSIKEAGLRVASDLAPVLESGPDRVDALCVAGVLPAYFREVPARLQALRKRASELSARGAGGGRPLTIAGGTDLYVQKGEDIPEMEVSLLNNEDPVRSARVEKGMVILDPRQTFEDMADDPVFCEILPAIKRYIKLIASWPVRTRSTIGGNICNASPIADMTCLLLALEATVELAGAVKTRHIPLKDFFLGYKVLDKRPDELLTAVTFPLPAPDCHINWEKVSKRTWLDIATVNAAAKIRVEAGGITEARLSLGGVAPTPLLLQKTGDWLLGKPLCPETALEAARLAQEECTPISDVRGSADYKRLLARQLVLAHFTELFPEAVPAESIYETL